MAQTNPTTANDWKFKTQHVQDKDVIDANGKFNNFISAESIILAAGPPSMKSAVSLSDLIPIGLCDSVNLQQNKNVIQLFEIGGRLPYLLPGRTFVQLQLNRVVFNGDSLLGAATRALTVAEGTASTDSPGLDFAVGGEADNEGRFYLNLASSFFNSPFGLAILIQDGDKPTAEAYKDTGQWVGGYYAENCLFQSHQMNIQGQQYIVMESALVRCGNLVPMAGLQNK
jgi:hypothetical protein